MQAVVAVESSSFISEFSLENRKLLLDVGTIKDYSKKDVLFLEGEEGTKFCICVKGNYQLYKTTYDGKEIVIKIIKPGEMFAETILFENVKYPVSAIAVANSKIFCVFKNDFMNLLDKKSFRNEFITLILRKQRYLAEQIKQISAVDLETRFFNFIKEQYGSKDKIRIAISKKNIAATIGVSAETLSRLLQKLSTEKKISWEDKYLKINLK